MKYGVVLDLKNEVTVYPLHFECLFAVCVKFLSKFINTLDDATKSNPGKIEADFRKMCKSTKGDDNRFVSIFNFVGNITWVCIV